MNLLIERTYHPAGTNGTLYVNNQPLFSTIELPWRENQTQVSCIPEGSYPLVKRESEKFGAHLLVQDVPERSLILIHPANNARKELRGCIAPVTYITGPGCGTNSRVAFDILLMIVYKALDRDEQVRLTIAKKSSHKM